MSAFAKLHSGPQPLVLPNAWDYASAAGLAAAGFAAVGTTSLGVAAAGGIPDGQGLARAETLALARRLTRLPCPFTVDVEGGFSADPAEVADLAEELAAAGAAGVNLEDGRQESHLVSTVDQCALIAAVKARVPSLFVNARTDTHWIGRPDGLADTLSRLAAYRDAGADGVFVPGIADPADIAAVVAAIDLPLNVLFGPGEHTVTRLASLGVRRISTGSLLYRVSLRAALDAAKAVRDGGPVTVSAPTYAAVQRLIG